MLLLTNFYSAPVGERSIAISLSVCLSVREHISGTAGPIFKNFMCWSPVAVARSSPGSVAICYVLPVLWITSRLAVMGQVGRPTTTSGVATPRRSLMSMNALCVRLAYIRWQWRHLLLLSMVSVADAMLLVNES